MYFPPPSHSIIAIRLQAKLPPIALTQTKRLLNEGAANSLRDAIGNEALFDQLSQLKVLNVGAGPFSDAWFKNHAPYAWSQSPQGERIGDMVAFTVVVRA